jgi:D-alanyl-D-alanine carboxypeptidase/D-alanyl-D-alanine-endopeptidase (penicillin-binding protein 4)
LYCRTAIALKNLIPRSAGTGCRRAAAGLLVLAAALGMLMAPDGGLAGPVAAPGAIAADMGFRQGEVGALLVDLQSGKVLQEENERQFFMPASVSKLATAYAAEKILGPDYRFSTLLFRRGADVYLQGGGDPVLTANDLQALAGQLRVKGVGGRFFYDDRGMAALPEVSDAQPVATPYNAGLSALDVDFNRVEVVWSHPGASSAPVFQVRTIADGLILPCAWVTFAPSSEDLPAGAPFVYAGDDRVDRWEYSKLLPPAGYTFLPVRHSSVHAALVFRQLALAAGVGLPMPEPGHVPANAVVIGRVDSAPLSEILSGLLRYSNNTEAELIGLAASRKLTGRSLSLADSSKALSKWLEQQAPEVDWQGFHLANHSGLTSRSRISARQMMALLILIAQDQGLLATLPPRDEDGGVADPAKPAAGRPITGKSGTMDYARALAGFFPAQNGRPLAFVIFIFDAQRRARLDATMDRRIVDPSPDAQSWNRRARALDDALLKFWMTKF